MKILLTYIKGGTPQICHFWEMSELKNSWGIPDI